MFGKHKSHELVTQSDMKEANSELLIDLKERFSEFINIKQLKESNGFEDYIKKEIQDSIVEAKQNIKNKFEVW